jgi:hypothetical protein
MYRRIVITSSLGALLALVLGVLPASAVTEMWNFSGAEVNFGTTHVFTSVPSGITITAHGFSSLNVPTDLFGKGLGTDESGLGLTNDPTGEGEISVGNGYVQLDITNVLASHLVNGLLLADSVTAPDAFNIWGSNTLGSLGTELIAGSTLDQTFFALPDFGSFNFYSMQAAAGNVLIGTAAASSTPEPGTMALFAVALMVAAPFVVRRRDSLLS